MGSESEPETGPESEVFEEEFCVDQTAAQVSSESAEDMGSSVSAKRFSEARFKYFPQRALLFLQSSVTRKEIFEMNY